MPENCRYCNTPLREGYLAGNKVLWWTKEEPGFLLKESDDDIKLNSSNTSWAKVPAKVCTTCKMIIATYD
jgi:hypothetical protein